MSTRYSLRTRPTAVRSSGAVTRFMEPTASEPRVVSPDVSDAEDEGIGPRRQDLPGSEIMSSVLSETDTPPLRARETTRQHDGGQTAVTITSPEDSSDLTETSDGIPDNPQGDGGTSRRRRAYVEEVPDEDGNGLSTDQTTLVERARQSMTAAERNLIDTRYHKVSLADQASGNTDNRDNTVPKISDPSLGKGKSIDPRNWGDANLSEDDTLDPEVQAQILRACHVNMANEGNDIAGASRQNADEDLRGDSINVNNDNENEESDVPPSRNELIERLKRKKQLEKELRDLEKDLCLKS